MDICKLIHTTDPPASPARVEPGSAKRPHHDADNSVNKRVHLASSAHKSDSLQQASVSGDSTTAPVSLANGGIGESSEYPSSSEYNSDFSASNSRRSTVTSVPSDDESSHGNIDSCERLLEYISAHNSKPIQLDGVRFIDDSLRTTDRQILLTKLHQKYVEPLLDRTGFKWIRKELPSKGKGVKIFSIKYTCSQQSNCSNSQQSSMDRSRNFSNPLKQYDCNSLYSIKYLWTSSTIMVSYRHCPHSPYKRLPEKLKPYILDRLHMKAVDLHNDIMQNPEFDDIKHLIYFSKVQSFWSKQRIFQKEKSTKEAFEKFFKE